MSKHGKIYNGARTAIDRETRYPLEKAVSMAKSLTKTNFDESVDVSFRLGVNPRHADQMVRGSVVLPHGTGKTVRVLVFAKGDKEKEATDAGADFVGNDELIAKIADGWLEFDKCIATPDMMRSVAKLGRTLGTRGMMPSPKLGTVTFDVAAAVGDFKKGKVEFKVDKVGNLHVTVGKKSFSDEQLQENVVTLMAKVIRLKPVSSKGTYLRNVVLSTTMGPGIKLDPNELAQLIG